jgi:hypothetical protein
MEMDLNERLTRVETKLDLLREDLAPRHADHERRIRWLERAVWMAAALGAVAGNVDRFITLLTTGA